MDRRIQEYNNDTSSFVMCAKAEVLVELQKYILDGLFDWQPAE